ncbi:SAV_6107 family HEPN domain-containing protein [Nocardia callitridis]|uniref:SAV-6107-like HEPN domain-containing protein n=1 Tax=Nocardia callitridis TaxID=648753 RepID=A0ABP9KHW4_9NOCA
MSNPMGGNGRRRAGSVGGSGKAGTLLARADGLLVQAAGERDPRERFRTAYLAALRGAGAVIAVTGADATPRARSRSAWALMQRAAPEFVMWADYFSARSEIRAALEAGLDRAIDDAEADEFASRVGAFLYDVEDLLAASARLHPVRGWSGDVTA